MKIKGKLGISVYEKVCESCNEGYLSNRITSKYCCNTCKDREYRKRLNNALKMEIKKRYGLINFRYL
jgi:reverse gyrase